MRNPNECNQRVPENVLHGKGCYHCHWYRAVTREEEELDETECSRSWNSVALKGSAFLLFKRGGWGIFAVCRFERTIVHNYLLINFAICLLIIILKHVFIS
jgi:hypothetical protein